MIRSDPDPVHSPDPQPSYLSLKKFQPFWMIRYSLLREKGEGRPRSSIHKLGTVLADFSLKL
jgi:hypothetical protein